MLLIVLGSGVKTILPTLRPRERRVTEGSDPVDSVPMTGDFEATRSTALQVKPG